MPKTSAGLLLWRVTNRGGVEMLIAHPGGPFWANKHEGAWSIPKGEFGAEEESAVEAAAREFAEEVGSEPPPIATWTELGETRLKSGKRILAWAAEGDLDVESLVSNTFEMQWPPRSGNRISVAEIDELRWCEPDQARHLLHRAQAVFVDRLLAQNDQTPAR